jgi:hypothetical protein
MKHQSCIVLMLFSVFAVLSFSQQPLVHAPKGGPGPVWRPASPAISMPKDGGGPVCFPGIGCPA